MATNKTTANTTAQNTATAANGKNVKPANNLVVASCKQAGASGYVVGYNRFCQTYKITQQTFKAVKKQSNGSLYNKQAVAVAIWAVATAGKKPAATAGNYTYAYKQFGLCFNAAGLLVKQAATCKNGQLYLQFYKNTAHTKKFFNGCHRLPVANQVNNLVVAMVPHFAKKYGVPATKLQNAAQAALQAAIKQHKKTA